MIKLAVYMLVLLADLSGAPVRPVAPDPYAEWYAAVQSGQSGQSVPLYVGVNANGYYVPVLAGYKSGVYIGFLKDGIPWLLLVPDAPTVTVPLTVPLSFCPNGRCPKVR